MKLVFLHYSEEILKNPTVAANLPFTDGWSSLQRRRCSSQSVKRMTCDNKGQKRSIAFSPIALYLGWTKFQRKLYFYNIYAIFWKSWNLPFSDRCSSYDFNTTDYVTYGGKLQLLSFETVISQNVKSVSNIVRVKVYFRKTVVGDWRFDYTLDECAPTISKHVP